MNTLDDVLPDGAVLTKKNWQDRPEEDNDRAKLHCFWRISVAFQQAGNRLVPFVLWINVDCQPGFSEHANALFQAQAHM